MAEYYELDIINLSSLYW